MFIRGIVMKIIHIAKLNLSRPNGPRYSVPKLVEYQNKLKEVEAILVNLNDQTDEEIQNYTFEYFHNVNMLKTDFMEKFNPDIIVYHCVYFFEYIQISKRYNGIPYIIVPRSSMTMKAQLSKKLKKHIANKLFFNKFISNAIGINFLTLKELEESKKFKRQDEFVIPNGIEIEDKLIGIRSPNTKLKITFLGRIDIYHKGLDFLIEALDIIKEQIKDHVIIELFGKREGDDSNKLYQLIKRKNMNNFIKINEPIYGIDKKNKLINTDILVMLSRFEGLPMAALEAMTFECACLFTEGTNLGDVVKKENIGWVVPYDPQKISKVILDAIRFKDEIRIKGKKARIIAEKEYNWNDIARQSINKYLMYIN